MWRPSERAGRLKEKVPPRSANEPPLFPHAPERGSPGGTAALPGITSAILWCIYLLQDSVNHHLVVADHGDLALIEEKKKVVDLNMLVSDS